MFLSEEAIMSAAFRVWHFLFFESFDCKIPRKVEYSLKFNIAPENVPSQKESSFPTIIFQNTVILVLRHAFFFEGLDFLGMTAFNVATF